MEVPKLGYYSWLRKKCNSIYGYAIIFMDEILVFSDNKTGDKVGVYYNTWLFIIRCVLVKYAHKTTEEVDEILEKQYYKKPEDYEDALCISHETEYHWAMLGAYGEEYWLKGVSFPSPIDYDEWYNDCIRKNKLHNPIKWF